MGDRSDAEMLTRRANNWENLFDPDNDLLTSRLANGQFEPGVTPTFTGTFPTDGEPYVEGDPYEYLWDVPNDYSALFSLLGGDAKAALCSSSTCPSRTASECTRRSRNEFDQGEQFAPDYAGDPADAQSVVNDIRNNTYPPGPDGLANNDDLGAESSQFIWEMLGMYPENSGHGHAGIRESRVPEGDDPPGQWACDQHQRAQCVPRHLLREVAEVGWRAVQTGCGSTTASSRAALRWTGPSAPGRAVGHRAAGRPALVHRGPAAGRRIPVSRAGRSPRAQARSSSARRTRPRPPARAVQRDAASRAGRVAVQRDDLGPAERQRNADGDRQRELFGSEAFNSVTVTITTATDNGDRQPPGLVAQPGSLLAAFDNAGISNDCDVGRRTSTPAGTATPRSPWPKTEGPGVIEEVDGAEFTWPHPTPG